MNVESKFCAYITVYIHRWVVWRERR